jgi:hypothetical protein
MIQEFAQGVIRFRWLIIVLSFATVAISGSGGRFLEFSGSYRDFFSSQNPQLQAFDALQNTYSKNDNVMFVIAPKDGKVFTRETLSAVQWLTKESWQIPYSRRVDSITNFQHTQTDGDSLLVRDLVDDPATITDPDLEKTRQIAVNEPLLVNRLISPRAHVTGVNVTVVLPEKKLSEAPEVVGFTRNLIVQAKERFPNVDIHLTGMVPFNNAFGEYAQKDMQTLVPLMYLVITIICIFSLRSFSGTATTLLVIFFSVITAMGLMGWLGMKLTGPSTTAPTVILTLAIADSIHLLSTMFHYMREGMSKRDAIVETMRINFSAVFLTSITTVIGFLSMNFSEVPPFRDLGNVVAIGVTAAWVYSIFFLPALMAVLPVRVSTARTHTGHAMEKMGNFVVAQRRPLLWGMALLTIGLVAFIPRNELNDDFVKYFDKSVDFRRASDFMMENLTGVNQIHYSLGAGESGGVSNPEYLRKLEEFSNWYRTQPGVVHVNSITDVMKRLNKNMHADDPAWYRIPDERELSAQYLLLYEMSLPFGLDLNDQINVDKSASRLVVTLASSTTKEILALEAQAYQWLEHNAPPAMLSHGTGPSVMFAFIGERNIRSMIGGNITSLLLVSLIIIVAVRSFKIGLLSLIPNLVPLGMAFGLWGLVVGQVGLALSVVTSLTFGIVVDDTIHFLTKYLHARRNKGYSPEDAVRYAYATVGTAMWVTSLILVAGFSVLMLSAFELNSGMGTLAAITIAFALLADYLLLPPLLMKLEEKKSAQAVTKNDDDIDPDSVPATA